MYVLDHELPIIREDGPHHLAATSTLMMTTSKAGRWHDPAASANGASKKTMILAPPAYSILWTDMAASPRHVVRSA
jgi:hypothetical protein